VFWAKDEAVFYGKCKRLPPSRDFVSAYFELISKTANAIEADDLSTEIEGPHLFSFPDTTAEEWCGEYVECKE
jgi:hypothetical protein